MRKLQNVFWLWLLTLLCVGGGAIAQTVTYSSVPSAGVVCLGSSFSYPGVQVAGLPGTGATPLTVRMRFVNGTQTPILVSTFTVPTIASGVLTVAGGSYTMPATAPTSANWTLELALLDVNGNFVGVQPADVNGYTLNPTPAAPTVMVNLPIACGAQAASAIVLNVSGAGSGNTVAATGFTFPTASASGAATSLTSPAYAVSATAYTVSVTTMSTGGCTSAATTASFKVNAIPAPVTTINFAPAPYCTGVALPLTAIAAAGTTDTFEWIKQASSAAAPANGAIGASAGTISGATASVYSDPQSAVGTFTYYARLVNTADRKSVV